VLTARVTAKGKGKTGATVQGRCEGEGEGEGASEYDGKVKREGANMSTFIMLRLSPDED